MSDGLTPHIKCDVELDLEGPTIKVVAGWMAEALLSIADRLEADEYEDGHYDVSDKTGRTVGTVYFDFYEAD